MKNILKKIKKYFKRFKTKLSLVGIFVVMVSLLSQIIFPMGAQAAEPQFNIFTPYALTQTYNQDYYLLSAKNDTQATPWTTSLSANAGDLLTFYLYYHNGVIPSQAYNTTARVALSSGQSTSQNVIAYLWADNTTNATPSNPLTQSLPVNLSSSQTLQYVSGSARWYPNQTDWRSSAATAFPNSQSNDQLFGSGIKLGTIQGCWEYSGAIVFQARVGNQQQILGSSNLSIGKTVRNTTSGQGYYSDFINASGNDRLMWQLQIQNTGNANASNVFIYDTLPSYMSYISGSTRVDGGYVSDGITSGGINVGSLSSGVTRTITFETYVNSSSYSNQTLTNYAYVRADGISERNDTAVVYLGGGGPSSGYLNISKTVRNLTTNQTSLSVSANANQGDKVLFLIQVNTPVNAQALTNVRVWDSLPAGLTYVNGSTRIDNGYTNDGLVTGGINIGTLYANQSRSINFEATVSNNYSNSTLINYAYTSADGIPQNSSFAQVVLSQGTATASNLSKRVENLTSPNGTNTDNTASVGDTLRYTISYVNNSGTTLTNAQILDVLPSYTTYYNIDGNGSYGSATNMITWNFASVPSGSTISVSYQIRVQNVPSDNYLIANTAALRADNLSLINSNEARTIVNATVQPTIIVPAVKGVSIAAVTGGDNMARNLAVSLMVSLWCIFFLYLIMENKEFWQSSKVKWAIFKIKMKER